MQTDIKQQKTPHQAVKEIRQHHHPRQQPKLTGILSDG